MKRAFTAAAALLLLACGGNAQKKSATAVAADHQPAAICLGEVAGTYKGTLPAADCPGIEIALTLRPDGTYTEHSRYIDRDAVFDEQGRYTVDEGLVTLTPATGEPAEYLRIEANSLRRLDGDRKPVEGALADYYVLTKTTE